MNKKECSKTLSGEHKWEDGSYTISGMYIAEAAGEILDVLDQLRKDEDDTCACGGVRLPHSDFCRDCI